MKSDSANIPQPTLVGPSPAGQEPSLNARTSTSRPKPAGRNRSLGAHTLTDNLLIIIGGTVLAEVIAMIVVYRYRYLPYYQQVALDATVMVVIILPLVFFLSSRPLLQNIQQREQTEKILQARLRLIQFANSHSLDDLLQVTLDEIEVLTDSTVGYFHFLQDDEKTLWLRAWSTNTTQNMCGLTGKGSHYDVDRAGVWADCVRERRPVIHNDYASLPNRKGMPEGHAPIVCEMAVPIMREGRIVAILGIGNKPRDFTQADVELVSTLADFAWDMVRDKQAGEALRESEEKFRTLVDWTYDWESWMDPQGNIVYISPSCERITGYRPEEFASRPGLIIDIIHPDDTPVYLQHEKALHRESAGFASLEYRILARDGSERWIEHVCRPLFDEDRHYLGRRISNREITERKQAEKEIQERNQKEQNLTQTIHTMQLDIARDLHDTIGQNISFLRMNLEYLARKKSMHQADMKAELQKMTRAANEAYDLIRGTLAILQSIHSTDLDRLFTRYAEQIEERSNFSVTFSSQGEPRPLAAPRMRQLFYIFREMLSNVEKHANASQVGIEMNWDAKHLALTISDNGGGFDLSQVPFSSHYGLRFMKERVEMLNGTIAIHSSAETGTQIAVRIPYEQS